MLIARVPVIPGYSQIAIGDRRPGLDNLPEWDDDALAKGIAISSSLVYIATADRSDFVMVDFRNEDPGPAAATWFDGKLHVGTLSAAPPDDTPAAVLWLPGETDWHTIITADSSEPENVRHVTVYVPELTDPRFPDGPWTRS